MYLLDIEVVEVSVRYTLSVIPEKNDLNNNEHRDNVTLYL